MKRGGQKEGAIPPMTLITAVIQKIRFTSVTSRQGFVLTCLCKIRQLNYTMTGNRTPARLKTETAHRVTLLPPFMLRRPLPGLVEVLRQPVSEHVGRELPGVLGENRRVDFGADIGDRVDLAM